MKKQLLTLTAMALLTGAAPAQEAAIREVEARFTKGMVNEDKKVLAEVLAEDFVGNWANGTVHDLQGFLSEAGTVFLLDDITYSDMLIRLYNEDTAVVTGRADHVGTLSGKKMIGPRTFTHVWVKQGGQWKMVSLQMTGLPKP